jgi:hypothetical protein
VSIDHDKISLMTEIDSLRRGWLACEAERDALAALVVELRGALEVFARAYRVSMLPFAPGIDEADGAHHWMPHGWPSVADFKQANAALSLPLPAAAERVKEWREKAELLDWAAEQESTIYYCYSEDGDEDNYWSVGQHEAADLLSALRAARGGR